MVERCMPTPTTPLWPEVWWRSLASRSMWGPVIGAGRAVLRIRIGRSVVMAMVVRWTVLEVRWLLRPVIVRRRAMVVSRRGRVGMHRITGWKLMRLVRIVRMAAAAAATSCLLTSLVTRRRVYHSGRSPPLLRATAAPVCSVRVHVAAMPVSSRGAMPLLLLGMRRLTMSSFSFRVMRWWRW